MNLAITEHEYTSNNHTTHYLSAGPIDGPLIIFVHGWPELGLSWRNQLPVFGGLGFRAIAPDMRGYGGSSRYSNHEDYALEKVVEDLLALLHGFGKSKAVWVGHDWGSPIVFSLASHHPQACQGVASLCVPYFTLERGLQACIDLVDRKIYPEAEYPAGQWDYQLYYQEQFAAATKAFEADPYNTMKLLFRKGDPAGFGQPAATSMTRANGGWFGSSPSAPNMPADLDVITEVGLQVYAEGLTRNGFFGPDSYYMNHAANARYAQHAVNDGKLAMPVLFVAAQYDYVCETICSELANPMREMCERLDEALIYSGHWMAQEKPVEVNITLTKWLITRMPELSFNSMCKSENADV